VINSSSVLAAVRYLDAKEKLRPDHASHLDMLLPDVADAPYSQTDLVTNWYKRNLRIFANSNRAMQFPNDRVLLLIGTGHLTIRSDLARSSNYVCPVPASEVLK
jgi:hypothetical protein